MQAIHFSGGQITGVGVIAGGNAYEASADLYVAALPVEVMRLLVSDELKQAEPRLAGLHRLRTRWMNGIMFYLDRDVPLVHGHTVYIDSPWALTSISQAQFWPAVELEEMGDGRVDGILSIDVSDWEAPGIVHGKQAMYCSKEEVREEVWAQLEAGLEDAGIDTLDEANVRAWFLDPAIVYPNPTAAMNLEPLLINTAGSWEDRPDAVTSVDNLFLASDYVRGHTDLATMEGANEAARRAVNGILERTGSTQPRCPVWKLTEPAIFAPRAPWTARCSRFAGRPRSSSGLSTDGSRPARSPRLEHPSSSGPHAYSAEIDGPRRRRCPARRFVTGSRLGRGRPSSAEPLDRRGAASRRRSARGDRGRGLDPVAGETRRRRLLLAAVPVHLALSLTWACGIALVAPRGREVPFGAGAGLAIAALDLGVIGRRFPRIRSLRLLPQVADHVAFGLVVGWVLSA